MHRSWYDRALRRVRDLSCGAYRINLEFEVRRVWCRSCQAVKRERLSWLAEGALHTKRFAYYVGRRCRSATIKDIAAEWHLGWDSVKELKKQYMRAQLAKAGTPGPKAIGIDEFSIRKGHTYRIVVSDLIRHRPIGFGGEDRSEASMAQFYLWLGEKKTRGIRLAVMDMWEPFRNATASHAPQAAIELVFEPKQSSRPLRSHWLVWLGQVSYGTYLFHYGVLVLAFYLIARSKPILGDVSDVFITVIALLATLLLVFILHHGVERPMISRGKTLAARRGGVLPGEMFTADSTTRFPEVDKG